MMMKMPRRLTPRLLAALAAMLAVGCEGPIQPVQDGPGPAELQNSSAQNASQASPDAEGQNVGSQSGPNVESADPFGSGSPLPPGHALELLGSFQKPDFQGSPLVNEVIGPEGGSLGLDGFEIVVPAGAVDRNTLFQIRRPRDAERRTLLVAEFLPHNQSFALPVTVRMPYAGTTLESDPEAAVVWWDGTNWIELPTTLIEGGQRIEAQTTHLSFWGVSLDGIASFAELSSGGE